MLHGILMMANIFAIVMSCSIALDAVSKSPLGFRNSTFALWFVLCLINIVILAAHMLAMLADIGKL